MAKSLRSKRKKRLRTLRREMVEPFYDKKDTAKFAAQEAAYAAPKLPVRTRPTAIEAVPALENPTSMDVEMVDNDKSLSFLMPVGGIGKKKLKKMKNAKRHGKVKGRINLKDKK